MSDPLPECSFVLKDSLGNELHVRVVQTASGCLEIRPEGYGEPDVEDAKGSPVFLDFYSTLQVIAYPNILEGMEMITIPLDGARESIRRQHERNNPVPP